MTVIRCNNCRKILFEADVRDGKVRKKCDNCGVVNEYENKPDVKPAGFLARLITADRPRNGTSPEA